MRPLLIPASFQIKKNNNNNAYTWNFIRYDLSKISENLSRYDTKIKLQIRNKDFYKKSTTVTKKYYSSVILHFIIVVIILV